MEGLSVRRAGRWAVVLVPVALLSLFVLHLPVASA
jgi:hypothetical protein